MVEFAFFDFGRFTNFAFNFRAFHNGKMPRLKMQILAQPITMAEQNSLSAEITALASPLTQKITSAF